MARASLTWQKTAVHPLSNPCSPVSALVYIGCAAALGSRFRLYSLISLAAVVTFNVLALAYAREAAAGEPTPWIGLYERIAFSAYFVWLSVLAVALWRRQANGPVTRPPAIACRPPPLRLPVPEAVHRYAANFDRSGQGLICQRFDAAPGSAVAYGATMSGQWVWRISLRATDRVHDPQRCSCGAAYYQGGCRLRPPDERSVSIARDNRCRDGNVCVVLLPPRQHNTDVEPRGVHLARWGGSVAIAST